ncbi:D-alanine--D-alanine ligase [uncultured Maricaulis sp.]|jgi:D-alanine-D-alanine ligase|uniref:D-alanine--D-alanine ligase n=1 Tax=uncultured Maricaulis sp. TaxID=174710 RepID=UPI0025DF13ED|nr:D-alanine--D-alanine ligase [uncultured Maricaulis sp.]
MSKRIAVLSGGLSPERDVSLVSGAACAKGLRDAGYDVVEIDAGRNLSQQLADADPDIVFNALHGEWGEDGLVQGVLEHFGKPYTHSGVLASALAMDKQKAKDVLRAAGIPCPEGLITNRFEAAKSHAMKPPYVAKPNAQGSSVGVHIVLEGANRPPAELGSTAWALGDEILIERYIPGRELTVAVMEDRALCVTEIKPNTTFYDYEAKYSAGGSDHILPAPVSDEIAELAKSLALKAHQALGCRGMTRSDFRYDTDSHTPLWLLEINTQPGMTPTSLAPEQAQYCGIAFSDLVAWMAENASCRR